MSGSNPSRTPAAVRAEEFLARVLPGSDAECDHDSDAEGDGAGRSQRRPSVDDRTQARLEAMGSPDRESW